MIYLDNAATTKMLPEVYQAMLPYIMDEYGNPGSIHKLGRTAAEAVAKARRQVADFIGAEPEQIIFTSGGSEANNLAILGVKDYLTEINKKHVIVSAVEHDSVLRARKALCHNNEKRIKDEFYSDFLGVNGECVVSVEDLEKMITEETGLVSVMYVNNETGAVNPINEISKLCSKHNVLFHTDCVQAAGGHKIDVKEIGCDFLSISGHKIHGGKGIGALYVKDMNKISPLIYGGSGQEFGYRGGTENVTSIVGFGEACDIMKQAGDELAYYITDLKTKFYNELMSNLSKSNIENIVTVNGSKYDSTGKILNLTLKNIDAETLILMLDSKGVYVSSGSACRNHESEPSRVLTAMGLSSEDARNSIRISFSGNNSIYDVDQAAKIMASCISTLCDTGGDYDE